MGGEIPQEFGLISSAEKIQLNRVNPQRHQEMKSQKRLKVSKQNEMKGWRYSTEAGCSESVCKENVNRLICAQWKRVS